MNEFNGAASGLEGSFLNFEMSQPAGSEHYNMEAAFERVNESQQIRMEGHETGRQFEHMTFNPKLAALRMRNPHFPISEFPSTCVGATLTANTAQDFPIPPGTKFVKFKGSGDYFVSRNGNAQIPPNTATQPIDILAMSGAGSNSGLYKPEETYFWVEEISSLSVIAPGTPYVTMWCWTQG
jgi:hypothetical protein